jgi:hypothetical protein
VPTLVRGRTLCAGGVRVGQRLCEVQVCASRHKDSLFVFTDLHTPVPQGSRVVSCIAVFRKAQTVPYTYVY